MNHIKGIVDCLNRPPFSLSLSLVQFHNKKSNELLQLLNDVFKELDSKQEKDLREESADQTATRMLEFITVLNYKYELELADFKDGLMAANANVVHPLLFWILERLQELKKRVHLARYLKSIDVPEQYFADPQVVDLIQKNKVLQGEFIEKHKELEKVRLTKQEPQKLQVEIDQLNQEKEALMNKLKQLRKKVEVTPEFQHVNFDDILVHTNKLRKEQEEEANLQQSLREQRNRLGQVEKIRLVAVSKLQELEASNVEKQDPRQLLGTLRREVAVLKSTANEKLQSDIHTRERTLRELERMMTTHPMTHDQVEALDQDIQMMEADISDMIAKQDAASAGIDSKVGFFRDRVSAAERKREKLAEELAELEDEKVEVERDLEKLKEEIKSLYAEAGGVKPKSDAEMQKYLMDLKEKSARYKVLKDQMKFYKDETSILRNTERILRSRDTDLEDFNRQLEREKGVEGFQDTQNKTEEVASESNAININKGATLDEMSKLVNSITEVIQQRKEMLAPQIKALKQVRNEFEEVEVEYKQRKASHEHTVSTLESDKYKLQEEVDEQLSAVAEEIRNVFMLRTMKEFNKIRIKMFTDESKSSYRERLEKTLVDQETRGKDLRTQRKGLDEHRDTHIEQTKLFQQLKLLLKAKLEVAKKERSKGQNEDLMMMGGGSMMGANAAGSAGSSEANFMRFGDEDEALLSNTGNQNDEVVME